MPLQCHGIIQRGPVELVEYFILNDTLSPSIAVNSDQEENSNDKYSGLRRVMECRVDLLAPYATTWPQAISLLLEPQNLTSSFDLMLKSTDQLSQLACMRASRLDWYTKRITLFGIVISTGIISISLNY